MSLYIKLFNNFWNHRKTVRLRASLGNDAYWIPPRLWSYASENQPDGDFSGYSPEELSMLIGYQGDATSMLKALQQALFLDGMKIKDWDEHNEYHHTYSERAKAASKARWEKERGEDMIREDMTREDMIGDKQCIKHATSINEPKNDGFNRFWEKYPKCTQKLICQKLWKLNVKDRKTEDSLFKALEIQMKSNDWLKEGGKYVPSSKTYLEGACWEDKVIKKESAHMDPLPQPTVKCTPEQLKEFEKMGIRI